METKYGFTLMTPSEFETWINEQDVARTIMFIQQHHTYIPSYQHFDNKSDHFHWQKSMRNSHLGRPFSDIAQHFSIFPDGKIITGRSLEWDPAGIRRRNNQAICIENVGCFDNGCDEMTTEQKNAIVKITSILCKRFAIPINSDKIIYHHWFDYYGKRTSTNGVKSCPGSNFFGGNTIADAEANFLPLIENYGKIVPAPNQSLLKYGYVTANRLNIRKSHKSSSERIGQTSYGSILRIYERNGNWYKISKSKQEWVYSSYVKNVKRASIKANVLNVRSGPSTNYYKVFSVYKNEEIFVYEELNEWSRISLNEFWVSNKYIDFE